MMRIVTIVETTDGHKRSYPDCYASLTHEPDEVSISRTDDDTVVHYEGVEDVVRVVMEFGK
jgi:hypothetical protein